MGRQAIVAAPATDLMTSMLDLPPRGPGIPFDQIARMEFARVHKCEANSFELSYWDLPTPAPDPRSHTGGRSGILEEIARPVLTEPGGLSA